MTPPFHLTSIRFSHYVEKVRWTLDYFEIPYTETPLMPVVHWLVTPFAIGFSGKGDSHSTRFSTPILRTDRGERLIKSSLIMKYLSERFGDSKRNLFPNDEALQIDEHYNQFLGPHTRSLFYFNVLENKPVIVGLAKKNVSALQSMIFEVLYGLCKERIIAGLGISPAIVERGIGYIYKEFDSVEKRLKDARPYLLGDQFTAADISFACLGGAIVLPQPEEGYAAQLPNYDCGCEQLVKISKDLRASPVGQWVLKLFRENRGKRIIPGHPPLF